MSSGLPESAACGTAQLLIEASPFWLLFARPQELAVYSMRVWIENKQLKIDKL